MKKYICLLSIALFSLVLHAQDKYFNISKSADIYNAVRRELEINYVDSIDHETLTNKTVNYMLHELDPYTVYIPKENEEALRQLTSGEYGGIGAVITHKKGHVVIAEIVEGSPAQKNGLRAGDIILDIDGEKTAGKTNTYAAEKLRGIPGTEVRIKLQRTDEKRVIEKRFLREVIQNNAVEYYTAMADSIGYIYLSDFTERAFQEFKQAIVDLSANHHIRKLIIDLRDNPGGSLAEAVNIAGLFLPLNSPVVETKGKNSATSRVYRTKIEPVYPALPLVILVNGQSASAAEILAGTFQDLDRAVVLGERTFGKGLVQNIRPMPYNGYLKITTAKYYIPSGRCVQAIDYANRREDGTAAAIPDSLTSEFYTANGRIVRDGGGILPDIILNDSNDVDISYYLYVNDIFFYYATQYVLQHQTVASPETFSLSEKEYADFVAYVNSSGFTYRLESEKYLQELRSIIRVEGYAPQTDSLISLLTAQLQPNIENDLLRFRSEITTLLEGEIVRRYYYNRGFIAYRLREDVVVARAKAILHDAETYGRILGKK
ncbi:MAG: S41 family peptidase [Prevotellaceae bacterium]|jgi:carboxyl-terminal processing protease|nr:S41 family peptidase [Prevotellaceae bacterium]